MSNILIITSYRWSSIASTKWASTARQMALDTKSFTVIPYIPFNASPRFYKPEELQAFRETLMEEIRKHSSKSLLVFGDHAFAALTGHYGGKRSIKYMRGFCLPSYAGVPCVGTFDLETFSKSEGRIFPQQSKLMGLIMSDVSTALAAARGRLSPCLDPSTEVRVHSGVDRLKELVKKVEADPTLLVAYDLETIKSSTEDEDDLYDFDRDNNLVDEGESEDESEEREWAKGELDTTKATITTVQFAIDDKEGWTVDWDRESIPLIKKLLESSNPKAGQNCFHKNTSVWMADGTWKAIWRVKRGEFVKTLDGNLSITNAKVSRTIKISSEDPWLEIRVDGAYNRGVGRWDNRGVVCTPDHEWFVKYGDALIGKRADCLLEGDEVILPRFGFDDVIFGSLLGDGHMSKTQLGRFVCGHTNREWALAKSASFKRPLKEVEGRSGAFGCGNSFWEFSVQVPKFWRKSFYTETSARKWQPPSLPALAIWYGDDGCLGGKGKKNQDARFALHKYQSSPEEVVRIREWFTSNFGSCSLHQKLNLSLHVQTSKKFFEAIAPFLHPSMEYKLPAQYRGKYNGWMEKPSSLTGKVLEVRPYKSNPKLDNNKYCLEISDSSHRFFTRAGLVRNCWLFDNPILYRHNCQINGPNHDTLWMWHSLQPDLPAHLQGIAQSVGWSFPWKHMAGSHFEFYGVVDVCAVMRIMSHLPNQLRAVGNWEWYDRLNREFFVVLEEMRARGIPVDASKLTEFRTRLTSEISTLNDEIQSLVPAFLRKPDPPNGYITPPEDVKALIRTNHSHLFEPATKVCKNGTVKTVASKVKVSDCYRRICEGDEEFSSTIEQVKSLGYQFISFDDSTRIARITDWNVGSSKQILEYLKLKGYPIPTRFKDGKATTSDKELDKLWSKTKDPILAKVRETRIRQKMRSSYTGRERDGKVVGGWYPEFDGRLRAVIGFGPATGQLSAKGVNVMTTPKRRKDMAKAFRKCIVAPDGYKLVSFDFKSFHALTTALEAKDHLLMRLSTLDVHSFVAGHLVKFPGIETCTDMNDTDLAAYLAEIRKAHPNVRDFQAKPAVHGTNFGQKHRRLYFEYRDHFESEAHAKRLLDLLQELFPNLFKWQEAICLKAHEDKQLISRWGAVRRFWEVKRYERTITGWKTVNGRDAEKAKAFLPSNDAHGMFRDKVLQAHERGWCERYGLVNLIHDDTLWLCPDALIEECIFNVRTLLSSPVSQLADPEMCPDGFVCGVDASVGQNWAEMEGV